MSLKFIALSGTVSVTENLYVYEAEGKMMVVDCGVGFPDLEMPGVDLVIPDFSYVVKNKEKLAGIIVSQGHEDHIGGIPHLVPELGIPVYASPLASALIAVRASEFPGGKQIQLRTYQEKDELKLGVFRVRFFRVTHSIPDSFGIIVETPLGEVIYTGDFKFELSNHVPTKDEFHQLTKLNGRVPLVLLSESTNAEMPGHTVSEKEIIATFDAIFAEAKGRLIISSFACTNIDNAEETLDFA